MQQSKLKKLLCLILCLVLITGCVHVENFTGSPEEVPKETEAEPEVPEEPDNSGYVDSSVNQVGMLGAGNGLTSVPTHDDDFVAVKGADPGHVIRVAAPAGYSAESVLAGMKFSNFSNPLLTDLNETDLVDPDRLVADGGNGTFNVTCAGGFHEGHVYQIELTDPNLAFVGEQGSVRLYNLTIAGREVNNMKLDRDVQFLSSAEINAAEAGRAFQLDGMYRLDNSNSLLKTGGNGSFAYHDGAYVIGDVIAIYDGVRPDQRAATDTESAVSYVKVTAVTPRGDGLSDYSYIQAEQDEVLFIPDVIPVHQEQALLMAAGAESSVTLESSTLQFSSDNELKEMRLDENTEVEPGDYLAFYTGSPEDGEVTAYAEVMDVVYVEEEDGSDSAEVSYRIVSMDEMMESIDVYHYQSLNEAQIRSAYSEEAIKASVAEELTNNGYLMQSTYNLAELALESEEVQEAIADTPIDQLTFYYGANEENHMSGRDFERVANGAVANTVDVKGDPDIKISPNIVHFAGKTGYGLGVRAEAYCKFIITIRGSDATKAAIRVNIVFFFETEVVVGLTVDATSVWRWKWIFPYIYDYTISGSTSYGVYVGAGFTASVTLIKNEKEKTAEEKAAGIDWPEGVKHTGGGEVILDLANYIKDLREVHNAIFPNQTTGGGSLAQKYKSFIMGASNSFVDLLNPNIFDWNGCLDPFHVFAFRIKADFIVSAQLNAAIGVSVNYERSYRETFSFLLIHGTNESNQSEETDKSEFQADAYIFGAIGLRAGVRLTIGVGLFDARLDSVGFEVEGGLYTRFWGFFYAGVKINDVGRATENVDAYYNGALRWEVGAYYNVTFVIQAGDGAIAYRKWLRGEEYPFFGLGVDSVTSDFNYEQGADLTKLTTEFTKDSNRVQLPGNLFKMSAMSIKDASTVSVDYSGRSAYDLYEISFDDPDFSYEFKDGKHYIVRNSQESGSGTVEMTITWLGSSFETLSERLYRTVKLDWECNLATITFMDEDGTEYYLYVDTKGNVLVPEDFEFPEPVKEGYKFLGWLDQDGNLITELPTRMPDENTVYTASWYRYHADVIVEYYLPYDTSGWSTQYYLADADNIVGIFYPGDPVGNAAETLRENKLLRTEPDHVVEGKDWFMHYKVNEQDSELSTESVNKDGTTTFKICLEWDACTITFDHGNGETSTAKVVEGIEIDFPSVSRQGYRFAGWMDEAGNIVTGPVVCSGDARFTAVWEMIPPTMTVEEQVKEKSWGMTYMWKTVLTQELVLDSYEITVQQILNLAGTPEGYTYSPDASGRTLEDVITVSEDGTTKVILRFTQLADTAPSEEPEGEEEP
ncbi:MAG: InlB B-repeat-containing protein [Lachnospiraceae bacterium]|nr:InlB B-repeat-containing protein [Lachnospiraceae bacterium]